MSALSVLPPYPMFFDSDGQALEDGFVWIGQPNTTPQNNLIAVYFDEALSIPAQQPLRTINGYASRNGSPAQLYISSASYSISVQDKNGAQVYTASNVIVPILPINPAFNGTLTLTLDDNGATDGPQIILDRNSATPADNDELGSLIFNGRDSGAAAQQYAEINAVATVVTAGAEDGALSFKTAVSGTVAERARIGEGVVIGNPAGGDKGAGAINASDIYRNDVPMAWGSIGGLYLINNQTGIAANTKVLFDGLDPIANSTLGKGTLSTVNSRYTNNSTDTWVMVFATVIVSDVDPAELVTMTLRQSNSTVLAECTARNDAASGSLTRTLSITRMVYLQFSDYLEIFLQSTGTATAVGGFGKTYFQIWEVKGDN